MIKTTLITARAHLMYFRFRRSDSASANLADKADFDRSKAFLRFLTGELPSESLLFELLESARTDKVRVEVLEVSDFGAT